MHVYMHIYVHVCHLSLHYILHDIQIIILWLIISLVCLIVPSGSVSNLHARDLRSTTIELSWDPVNEREQNGIILSYNIYYHLLNTSDLYTRILGVTERVSDEY